MASKTIGNLQSESRGAQNKPQQELPPSDQIPHRHDKHDSDCYSDNTECINVACIVIRHSKVLRQHDQIGDAIVVYGPSCDKG